MKFATLLMSLVFAGAVAHAQGEATQAPSSAPAVEGQKTEAPVSKKEKKHKKHDKKDKAENKMEKSEGTATK